MLAKLIALLLIVIPLYPKFPILSVSGTFVSVRLEDFLIAIVFLIYIVKKPSFPSPVHKSLLLYLFIGFTSAFSAIVLTKSVTLNLGILHLFRRLEYMSLFFVAFSFLRSLSQIPFLIRTILITSLLVAIYGLGQQFLGFPVITTTNSEFSKGLALTLGPNARINSTFSPLLFFFFFFFIFFFFFSPRHKKKANFADCRRVGILDSALVRFPRYLCRLLSHDCNFCLDHRQKSLDYPSSSFSRT